MSGRNKSRFAQIFISALDVFKDIRYRLSIDPAATVPPFMSLAIILTCLPFRHFRRGVRTGQIFRCPRLEYEVSSVRPGFRPESLLDMPVLRQCTAAGRGRCGPGRCPAGEGLYNVTVTHSAIIRLRQTSYILPQNRVPAFAVRLRSSTRNKEIHAGF